MGKSKRTKAAAKQEHKTQRRRQKVADALGLQPSPASRYTGKYARTPAVSKSPKNEQQLQQNRQHAQAHSALKPPVLIVGDGDLSFSAALAQQLLQPQKLTATTFDTPSELHAKYGQQALQRVKQCEDAGAAVLHGVDAACLLPALARGPCGTVMFNFPHTGSQRAHENRAMLHAFFTSCGAVLAPGGEVHVAIKVGPPYSRWDIPELAAHAGFVEVRRVPFRASQYPGYHHRTTESGAEALDVDSTAARKLLSTLVFKRRRA